MQLYARLSGLRPRCQRTGTRMVIKPLDMSRIEIARPFSLRGNASESIFTAESEKLPSLKPKATRMTTSDRSDHATPVGTVKNKHDSLTRSDP